MNTLILRNRTLSLVIATGIGMSTLTACKVSSVELPLEQPPRVPVSTQSDGGPNPFPGESSGESPGASNNRLSGVEALKAACESMEVGGTFMEETLECRCSPGTFTTHGGKGACVPVTAFMVPMFGMMSVLPDGEGGASPVWNWFSTSFSDQDRDEALLKWQETVQMEMLPSIRFPIHGSHLLWLGTPDHLVVESESRRDDTWLNLLKSEAHSHETKVLVFEPQLDLFGVALGASRVNLRNGQNVSLDRMDSFRALSGEWDSPVTDSLREATLRAYAAVRDGAPFRADRVRERTDAGCPNFCEIWRDLGRMNDRYRASYKKTYSYGTPESRLVVIQEVESGTPAAVIQLNPAETVSIVHVFEVAAPAAPIVHQMFDRDGHRFGAIPKPIEFDVRSELKNLIF